MTLHLHNTWSRTKEPFVPLAPPRVTFYNCGPTVYDAFTIGNARNFVVVDVLRRYLQASGFAVRFVQNITDIDDKIIKRANDEGRPAAEVARTWTDAYFRYADALGIARADVHPKATDHLAEMIAMIETLIARGHAYASEGDVYFDQGSFAEYGRLSGKKLDEMEQGERVDEAILRRKRSPQDFALWKAAKPGEPSWSSPWGEGRPGWHLECSVMSMKHLGETIDIHSGGVDLIFPHHENEVAQSCCTTGRPFVRFWVHNGFLTFGEKVSKSTMTADMRGIFMIDKALERFGADAIRYFLLTAHYRSPLVFAMESMEEARARCERIRRMCESTRQFIAHEKTLPAQAAEAPEVTEFARRFREGMDDDLNTPVALAVLADALTQLNTWRTEGDRDRAEGRGAMHITGIMQLYQVIGEMLDVLGLRAFLFERAQSAEAGGAEALIQAMIAARATARKAKAFALADAVRGELGRLGVALEDGASGTVWRATDGAPDAAALRALAISLADQADTAGRAEVAASLRSAAGA